VGGLTLLIFWTFGPRTMRLLREQPEGYEQVFGYIAEQQQAGDVVMSPQPPACALALGRPCDYFARERGYEPYVTPVDGVLVDRWTGAPLMRSADQLEQLVKTTPRVWLVTDGHRLAERYYNEFVRVVIEQFDTVFEERDVNALLAEGWREPPAYTRRQALETPAAVGSLRLVEWERTEMVAGQPLEALLTWRLTEKTRDPAYTSLQLVAADGTRLAQVDSAPARGLIPTTDETKAKIPDPKMLALPAELAPGRYRLEVVAYNVKSQETLGGPVVVDWLWVGPAVAAPREHRAVGWENGLALVGHDGLPEALAGGETLGVRFVWQAAGPVDADYTTFVHLVGPEGQMVAQSDQAPENGFYPTSRWAREEPVAATHQLGLPETLVPGEYRLLVGWYRPDTGARAVLGDSTDVLELGKWTVE
jgi:hypothetical protein